MCLPGKNVGTGQNRLIYSTGEGWSLLNLNGQRAVPPPQEFFSCSSQAIVFSSPFFVQLVGGFAGATRSENIGSFGKKEVHFGLISSYMLFN